MNKKLKPNSYAALDAENHFHPYSNARRIEEQGPMVISEGEGIYVWGDDGKKYLEAMAGLWSVAVGFGEERLIDAATKQLVWQGKGKGGLNENYKKRDERIAFFVQEIVENYPPIVE